MVADSFNVIMPDSFAVLSSFWKRKHFEALNIVTVAALSGNGKSYVQTLGVRFFSGA